MVAEKLRCGPLQKPPKARRNAGLVADAAECLLWLTLLAQPCCELRCDCATIHLHPRELVPTEQVPLETDTLAHTRVAAEIKGATSQLRVEGDANLATADDIVTDSRRIPKSRIKENHDGTIER